MNASDRAMSILRAGLAKPAAPVRELKGPRYPHPNKTDFERHLNDLPFPANPPPSLVFDYKGKTPRWGHYGAWLSRHNRPIFDAEFAKWRATQ